MNNFQKISSAVIIFGLLGLGACASTEPKKEEGCIALIPEYEEVCGDKLEREKNGLRCPGDDYICLGNTPSRDVYNFS